MGGLPIFQELWYVMPLQHIMGSSDQTPNLTFAESTSALDT